MRFLCVADLHIGGNLLRSGNTIIRDWKEVLHDLWLFIRDNEVTHLIVAGDVFDKARIKNQEISVWRTFVHQCVTSGCRPLYIPGNHETESNQEGTALPSAVNPEAMNMTGTFDLQENGPRVIGIAEGEQETVKEQIKRAKQCDLLVVHASFRHLFKFDNPVDISDVPSTVKNVLTGHIHKPDATGGLASGGYVFSPGPLHATEAKQMGSLGGWLTDDLADPDEWKWCEISSQPIVIYDINEYESHEQLLQAIRKELDEFKQSEDSLIPLTVDLKYHPEQRNKVLSVVRQFAGEDHIRFMKTVMQNEEVTQELDNIASEIVEGKYSITESIDTALQKTIPESEQDVRDFLYPLVHSTPAEAKEKLRNWLQEQEVSEISV